MQSLSLMVDSYRVVMSRKLFWVTLVISAVVVLLYASMGFDESGVFLFFGAAHFDSEYFVADSSLAKALYLGIFSTFIIGIWLSWAATILAMVSTSPIFADFIADGAIDLVLSKPINRAKVFFVKYLGGLLFVILQVSFFTLGVFLCVGWRVGEWNLKIFWAIPIITAFFSYLYCVMVLFTLVFRSSMAAFLLTMAFWFVLWALNTAERSINETRLGAVVRAEFLEERIERPPDAEDKTRLEKDVDEAKKSAEGWKTWQDRIRTVQMFLPKTTETIGKLSEWMTIGDYSMNAILRGDFQQQETQGRESEFRERSRRVEEDYANRSGWSVLGGSLLFEAFVLALGCWLFCRRDF